MEERRHILTETRGRKPLPPGKRYRKVAISLPPDLLDAVDSLPGERSGKVAAALRLWLVLQAGASE